MLRDAASAEDATQEAFARLVDAEITEIRDMRGWLIVVTSRICLDQMGSARARRETLGASDVIDTVAPIWPAPSMDPADRVTLDDEVRLVLLVVLERLSPPKRVAFVLHDVFGLSFDTVDAALGRPAPTCRQLAHRARLALRAERPVAAGVDMVAQRRVTERFIAACANGDLDGLLAVLAPDVEGTVDLGPTDRRSGVVVHGAHAVGRDLLRHFGSWTTLVEIPAAEPVVVVSFVARRTHTLMVLGTRGGAIVDIHVTADPVKLAALELPPAQRTG